jgi:hypothetical protein
MARLEGIEPPTYGLEVRCSWKECFSMGETLRLVTNLTWREYLSEFITTMKIQGCRERTIED